MKKHLQKISCIVAMMPLFAVQAQPVLTGANTNPALGDQFTFKYSAYVSPGSAGSNQTWNLSAMSATATSNYTVVSSSSTPSASSFPSSNVCMNGGSAGSMYFNAGSSMLQNYGTVASSVAIAFTNPENQLTYPFNYTNSFTDTWGGTFTNSSVTFYRTGTTTVTADGYGTVTTPAGIFANVMRVHYVQSYRDSANLSGPIIITYLNDEYLWYLPGNHGAIASVSSFTSNGFSGPTVSTSASYLNNVVNGIEENSFAFSQGSVFPNPAAEQLNYTYSSEAGAFCQISIYNVNGQKIKTIEHEAQAGVNTAAIPTQDLSAGVYYLEGRSGDATGKREKFVITR